jgi:hypothetical protein
LPSSASGSAAGWRGAGGCCWARAASGAMERASARAQRRGLRSLHHGGSEGAQSGSQNVLRRWCGSSSVAGPVSFVARRGGPRGFFAVPGGRGGCDRRPRARLVGARGRPGRGRAAVRVRDRLGADARRRGLAGCLGLQRELQVRVAVERDEALVRDEARGRDAQLARQRAPRHRRRGTGSARPPRCRRAVIRASLGSTSIVTSTVAAGGPRRPRRPRRRRVGARRPGAAREKGHPADDRAAAPIDELRDRRGALFVRRDRARRRGRHLHRGVAGLAPSRRGGVTSDVGVRSDAHPGAGRSPVVACPLQRP